MRLAIDAMGGDFAPGPIVDGTLDALELDDDMEFILVGDQAQIEPLLEGKHPGNGRLSIVHTPDVVSMTDSPTVALRKKPKASINICWSLLAKKEVDGLVSAGNTGAV